MTRSERRVLADTAILGILLTLIVVGLDYSGFLTNSEQYFYDLRAQRCQFRTPPPTDKLIHLDIDDKSLELIGAWPWPRSRMARIIDEIGIAGAKALAMDVIYSEPQEPGWEPIEDSGAPTTRPATRPAEPTGFRRLDHDAAFAEALGRYGRAVIPVSLNLTSYQPDTPLHRAMVRELHRNPDLDRPGLFERIQGQLPGGRLDLPSVIEHFELARHEAMYARVSEEMRRDPGTLADLRRRILPQWDEQTRSSPSIRLLESEYRRYCAIEALRRFGRAIPDGLPPLMSTREEQPTLEVFSRNAAGSGFVDYPRMGDGIVRNVPLWANHRDWAMPQMGLSLACAMLDVKPGDLKLLPDRIIIPRAEGDIAIPVRLQETARGRCGMFFDIPWFGASGPTGWENMYDYPLYVRPRQHVPLYYIWEACQLQDRIIRNNRDALRAIITLLEAAADAKRYELESHPPDPRHPEAHLTLIEYTSNRLDQAETIQFWSEMDPDSLSNEDRVLRQRYLAAFDILKRLGREIRGLKEDLGKRRDELRQQLGGKALLMGWTAVGALADQVPTSLHPRCPGVVVHGAVFNAILTGEFWYAVPWHVTGLITVFMGLLTTAIVAWLTPWRALLASIVVGAGYALLNGLCLFDAHNLLVGVTAPLLAVAIVWSGGTLARYMIERNERARVTRRFSNYVDPALVDYVLERDDARFDGQEKELTVVFTDLAGFTSVSEQLRERTIPLLNQYLGLMVPIIRKHTGFLNKFLGDGIMFIFGAPRENAAHATAAVRCALEMQQSMVAFNQSLAERGLPALNMRIGIASGLMVVGDAGPSDGSRSDYTVLGDTVNLGSRLESANKAFGSSILLNDRARDLVGDAVLFRPIGRIQVVGKLEGVMTYEPLAFVDQATAEQTRLAELTSAVIAAFREARFADCIEAIEAMEEAVGESKLTRLYRTLCQQYLQAPLVDFAGVVVLSEK